MVINMLEEEITFNFVYSYFQAKRKQILKLKSKEELLNVLEEFKGAAEGFKTITEFLIHVNNVEEQIESSKAVEDGVILSTIHGVKGMEYS